VPHHGRRFHAPTAPQRRQGVFQSKHHGLRVTGLIYQDAGLRVQQLVQRPIQHAIQTVGAAVQRSAERGLGLVQGPPHARVLSALARKQERNSRFAVVLDHATPRAGGQRLRGQPQQFLPRRGDRIGDDGSAMREMHPSGVGRESQVRQ